MSMIEHCRDRWPEPNDRPRYWVATFLSGCVVLRHYAILTPGEDLTEYPRTLELTRDEWSVGHADYGLDVDGVAVT